MTLTIISSIFSVALCTFLLVITVASYRELQKDNVTLVKSRIRHIGRDTVGRKVYRYSLIIALVLGVWFGIDKPTYYFILVSTVSDRLMIYRVCKPKTWLGRLLVRVDW